MSERCRKGQGLDQRLSPFHRNISSCLKLHRAVGPEETLHAVAAALKRHDFVSSVHTYLLGDKALVCISDPGPVHDLSLLNQAHPAVLALFKHHVTVKQPDGYVELAASVGGPPGPTAVIHVLLTRADADARLLAWHLFQAASANLRVPQVPPEHDVTGDAMLKREALAAREDLLNSVIHEIKNALAAILAHLDVLRLDRGDDPVVAERINVLIPQLQRLA